MYCIVLLAVRIVLYHIVLYSPRKYSTNHGSYVLCGLFYCITRGSYQVILHRIISYCAGLAVCMYCIVSLTVRIVSYRIIPYWTPLQGNTRIVCTWLYALYCRPIVHSSFHIVSYRTVHRVVPYWHYPRIVSYLLGSYQDSILSVRFRILSSFSPDCIMISLGPYWMKPTVRSADDTIRSAGHYLFLFGT
jgi:hypothetical protein